MKSAMKTLVVVAILMVTFGLPVMLELLINPPQQNTLQSPTPTVTQADVTVLDDIRFLSIPPVLVSPKSTFLYKMVVTSLSGEKVTIEPVEKPDWMAWDSTTQQLSGIVPETGSLFTITMRASTIGGAIAEQSFTVTIDQQEVKGATTVALWKDPFHPNLADVQVTPEVYLPEMSESESGDVLGVTVGEVTVPQVGTTINNYVSRYGVWVVGAGLLIVVGYLLFRVFSAQKSAAQLARKGVIIERGSR